MDPLPIWYAPFEDSHVDTDEYPIHALTQRPMAMYHSWGTQNAWLRQIHGTQPALCADQTLGRSTGSKMGDWARVTSPHGEITVPVAEMAALNSEHGLDLERHRQTQRRLGLRGRARGEPRASC